MTLRPPAPRGVPGSGSLPIALLLLLAGSLALATWVRVPYSAPVTGGHLRLLDDLVAGRPVPYTPYSLGYWLLAARAIRLGGQNGLFVLNTLVYLGTVLLAYATLHALGLRRAAFLGAAAVACYPHYFLAIKKLSTTGLSALLLVAFCWLVVHLHRPRFTAITAVSGGGLFAAMLLERPNLVALAPLAAFAALRRPGHRGRTALWIIGAAGIATALLAFAIVPAKGRFVVFDPYYAAYAFANGAHAYAFQGFLHDYNGELAMPAALSAKGLRWTGLDEIVPEMTEVYVRPGWEYVREDPARYVVLTGLKTVNLFRPDFRDLRDRAFLPWPVHASAQLAITSIFVLWATLRWRYRRLVGTLDGVMALPMLMLYVTPFVLTNTDTRYRVPFDAVFLLDITWSWVVARDRARASPSSARSRTKRQLAARPGAVSRA